MHAGGAASKGRIHQRKEAAMTPLTSGAMLVASA